MQLKLHISLSHELDMSVPAAAAGPHSARALEVCWALLAQEEALGVGATLAPLGVGATIAPLGVGGAESALP